MYDSFRGISMNLPLNKQTAVITGAGSAEGIGFAIARRLYAAGVRVVITSTTDRIHTRARELDAGGEGVLSFIADLTIETDVQRFVDSVLSRAGRIDILVNNAGMAQTGRPADSKSLIETSFAEWQNQISITLHTAFRMTRAVLPAMAKQKYGRIVNVTSVTGPLVSNPGSAAYGAAKAAMESPSTASLPAGSQRHPRRSPRKSPPCIRRSAAPARRTKSPPRFASSPRRKLPTSPDKSWWSMAATSCRKRKFPEASFRPCWNLHAETNSFFIRGLCIFHGLLRRPACAELFLFLCCFCCRGLCSRSRTPRRAHGRKSAWLWKAAARWASRASAC